MVDDLDLDVGSDDLADARGDLILLAGERSRVDERVPLDALVFGRTVLGDFLRTC